MQVEHVGIKNPTLLQAKVLCKQCTRNKNGMTVQ
jgi:hypothetical protein